MKFVKKLCVKCWWNWLRQITKEKRKMIVEKWAKIELLRKNGKASLKLRFSSKRVKFQWRWVRADLTPFQNGYFFLTLDKFFSEKYFPHKNYIVLSNTATMCWKKYYATHTKGPGMPYSAHWQYFVLPRSGTNESFKHLSRQRWIQCSLRWRFNRSTEYSKLS